MRALLVVNPKATATTARARDVLAHALASESTLEVVQTKARGHGTELAAGAADDGFDVVVALGGDGTVNEVVNGLLSNGPRPGLPALAVVPGGSTNVFARALGLPNQPLEATSILLDALRNERRRTLGLGHVTGLEPASGPTERWFLFNAGLGLDADVVRTVDRKRAQGRRATPGLYSRAGFARFFAHAASRGPLLTLEHPGAEPERVGLALICNASPWTYLGNRPVDPCPRASFDLGLDAFALRRLRTLPTLRHLQQILASDPRPRGRHLVAVHDAPHIVLSSDEPQPFQVDGEDLGDQTRVVLTSRPGALDVLV